MIDIWSELWEEFAGLAGACIDQIPPADGPGENPIQRTIRWQLEGRAPFVKDRIPASRLQLPELYSGAPWRHRQRWIACVALNPSIDARETFPQLSELAFHGVETLVPYFDDRFNPVRIEKPLPHGRDVTGRAKWVVGAPSAAHPRTWVRLDAAVRQFLPNPTQAEQAAPLGSAASIMDVVPWKFRRWTAVDVNLRNALLALGAIYLRKVLSACPPPAVIIALGEEVIIALQEQFPEGEWVEAPARLAVRGHLALSENSVPVYSLVHPGVRNGSFERAVTGLAPTISALL